MASSASEPSHPGLSVGPTSEFSLFFHVKPGEGPSLRSALAGLAEHAWVPAGRLRDGYPDDPRGALRALRRRHPARVHHQLRRTLGGLHGGLLHLRADAHAVRRHLPPRGGVRRAAGPGGGEGVRPERRADGSGVRPQLRRHRQGDPEGPARERGLPAGSRPSRRPPSSSSIRRCSRCSTRPATSRAAGTGAASDVGPHLWAARSRRPDRGHHRRVRVPEPRAGGSSRARREHAADGQALRPVLGGTALPLQVATARRAGAGRSRLAVRSRRRRVRPRLRLLRTGSRRWRARTGRHAAPSRPGSRSRSA